jgi:hypothetical protein
MCIYIQNSSTIWIFHIGAFVYASVVIPLLIAFWKIWITRYQIENFAITKLKFSFIMPFVIDLSYEYANLIRCLDFLVFLVSIFVIIKQIKKMIYFRSFQKNCSSYLFIFKPTIYLISFLFVYCCSDTYTLHIYIHKLSYLYVEQAKNMCWKMLEIIFSKFNITFCISIFNMFINFWHHDPVRYFCYSFCLPFIMQYNMKKIVYILCIHCISGKISFNISCFLLLFINFLHILEQGAHL